MSIIHSSKLKMRATGLRARGYSLKEIVSHLDIPKSTVQGWIRGIRLTDKQKIRLQNKELTGGLKGRFRANTVLKEKIEEWKRGIRKRVSHLKELPYKNKEIGKVACGLLYVCEGGKYPSTRQLTFGNSDPKMIALFLVLLRKWFCVDEKKFRCRVMHRWDQDGDDLKKFWSNVTCIPLKQFYRSYADKRTINKPTSKHDYKGVCAIMYFNTDLQFELQSIGEAILEFGGADGS